MIVVDADLDGRRRACRVVDGRIAEIAPVLAPVPGERVLDARGGALLPGLIDHHLHLFALAAARTSLDLAGVEDLSTVAVPPGEGWLRAVGASREWSPAQLDDHFGPRPVRVQHRSGALWMLSSTAIDLLGAGLTAQERASGRVWRDDRRLRALLGTAGAELVPDLPALGAHLARLGITRLVDATPDLDEASLATLRAGLPQRVESLSGDVRADGLPVKIVVPDHDLPDLPGLVRAVRRAREAGRPVAVHAVTAVALALVVAALDEVGVVAGDRIEHAAVCDDRAADRLAEAGLTVVTQPSLWRRRAAEFRAETPPAEHPMLWRHASLLSAGVPVAVSSDAPYGEADPWATVRAAATRDDVERVPVAEALRTMLTSAPDPAGAPRRVVPGAPAELVVLDRPLAAALDALAADRSPAVVATVIGDEFLHPTSQRETDDIRPRP